MSFVKRSIVAKFGSRFNLAVLQKHGSISFEGSVELVNFIKFLQKHGYVDGYITRKKTINKFRGFNDSVSYGREFESYYKIIWLFFIFSKILKSLSLVCGRLPQANILKMLFYFSVILRLNNSILILVSNLFLNFLIWNKFSKRLCFSEHGPENRSSICCFVRYFNYKPVLSKVSKISKIYPRTFRLNRLKKSRNELILNTSVGLATREESVINGVGGLGVCNIIK